MYARSDASDSIDAAEDRGAGASVEGAWTRFSQPETPEDFLQAWFALLCEGTQDARRAVLLLEALGGGFATAAAWRASGLAADADDTAMTLLQEVCEKAQESGGIAMRSVDDGVKAIGYPLAVDGRVHALAGMTVTQGSEAGAIRGLQWGMGWLRSMLETRRADTEAALRANGAAALKVLASLDDSDTLDGALKAFANEVLALLATDRVGVALLRRGRLRIRALSQTAGVEHRTGEVRSLVHAMEEGRVQLEGVIFPPPGDDTVTIAAAHQSHAARSGALSMISVPLIVRGEVIGMVSAERMVPKDGKAQFTAPDRGMLDAVASLCAPPIALRQREDRLLSGKGRKWSGRAATALLGRRHPGIKLLAIALIAVGAALATVQTNLRVTAPAQLRGTVQRAAVAPFDGYIDTAEKRAGGTVNAGDLLATLDDRDLRLEKLKWDSERAKLIQEQREALAEGDRVAMAALGARIARVEAEAALAAAQLERIGIVAPLAGLIVSGDLSERLGAPVREGEVLFEIASGTDFKLSIDVGEYDIGLVEVGAPGTLALSGYSGLNLGFEVTRIASVAEAADGRNAFAVEARLLDPPENLRPGLSGVAKIEAGRASLIYAGLRGTIERLRIFFWRWLP